MIAPPSLPLTSGWFLAIDPAVDRPAAAAFQNGNLDRAERVRVPRAINLLRDEGERVRQISLLITAWARMRWSGPWVAVVSELPQIYRANKSKGNPNQLIPLAMIGAAVTMALGAPALAPNPADWIGQIPKSTTGDPRESPRGKLIWSRLGVFERARVELTHDAFDAAGIGLWALGRLGKVYPGST